MRTARWRALALVPLALGVVLAARGQEAQTQVFTLEDREVDDALERARTLELQGTYAAAGEEYAKLEALLEKKHEKDPDQRIVTKVGPEIDRGVALILRERLRKLPEEGLRAYRTLADARARAALEDAFDRNDADAIEAVAERFALSSAASRALQALASISFEGGDLARAARAFQRLENDGDAEVAQNAAFGRLCAAVGLEDPALAADALASFEAKGGDANAPRIPLGGKVLSAREAVDAARSGSAKARPAKSFDPARLLQAIPLDAPELPPELAQRLERVSGVVPAFQQPVWDPETRLVLVCDEKTVRAVDPSGHGAGWTYSPVREGGEPGRLEVATVYPALGQGRLYATLHLNRPAKRVKKAVDPKAPPQPPRKKNKNDKKKGEKEDEEDDIVRLPDWRIVALDRKTGRLQWDAADRGPEPHGFQDFARDAEWVSSPCFAEGQVLVTVLARKGSDLRCYVVGLDATSGKVRFRAFLASRLPYDFLGIGAPPAAPAVRNGRIFVSTGLGAVACVEPVRGEVVWLARYPSSPERSQVEVVQGERRFRATPPLVRGRFVVVAPVDAQEVFALDPLTGARRWSAPRGAAHTVAETAGGTVLLVSDRVLALDGSSGACRFEGEALGAAAVAPPACFEKDAVVPLPTALVRVSLEDGKVLARLRFEEPLLESGAVAPLDEGRLASASFARANVYQDASLVGPETSTLDRGEASLILGESAARRGDVEVAGRELEKAVHGGLSNEKTALARRLAFAAFAEQAAKLRAKGDREGFLAAATSALDHADKAIADARKGPASDETNVVVARAASLRRAFADVLGAGTKLADWTRAANEYQKLLVAPAGTLVLLDAGLQVDARAYAKRRVRELVRAHGRECYAISDRSAVEHMKTSQATGTKEGLERVIDLYPASAHYSEALWELHRFYLGRDLESNAAMVLEQFLDDEPENALVPEALARLAQLEERMNRPARARAVARRLAALGEDLHVRGLDEHGVPPPERPAPRLAKEILARTERGDPDALALQDAASDVETPLRRVFRSTTELSQTGAELVEPRNVALAPRGRYVVKRTATIETRSTESGVMISQCDAPLALQPDRRWLGWSGGLLLVPGASQLVGFDSEAGKLAWTFTPIPRVGRPQVSPDDIHAVEYGADTAIVLTRWNELVAVDAKTGRPRWSRLIPGRTIPTLLARGKIGVLVSDVKPSRIEGVDLDTGKTVWTWAPEAGPGVERNLGLARWVGASSLACVIDNSRRLAFLDAADGKLGWTASSGETGWFGEPRPSPDGRAVVVRGTGGASGQFWVYDARTGKELWRDDGFGAVLPGPRPETEGARPALEEVIAGETAVYTFRQRGGAVEVWSQDLVNGTKNWEWVAHGLRGPTTLVETPTAILVARDGRFDRPQLVVLGKGTGKPDHAEDQIALPGRKFVGRGLMAAGGCVVASTDRGTFGLTHVDDERLARATLQATLDLAEKDTPERRAALADRLFRASPPRVEEAIDSVTKALVAESMSTTPETYDRLFAQLAALSETSVELGQPHYDIRRMPRPPEIDGELNDWWRGWSSIDLVGPRYVSPVQLEGGRPGRWNGPEDLSAKLYMGWDEKYFYFALDVMDSDLRPYDSESPKWIGDCLLIAIDTKNDGGFWFAQDDLLLSLALTLPKKKKDEEKDKKDGEEAEKNKPEGKYFVKRKEDGSGAIYECQVPWSLYEANGATNPGQPGFTFGFNVILTDDDGDRIAAEDLPAGVDPKTLPEGKREGDFRGALKTLQLTPSVLLHEKKERLWQGYIPEYFAKITLR